MKGVDTMKQNAIKRILDEIEDFRSLIVKYSIGKSSTLQVRRKLAKIIRLLNILLDDNPKNIDRILPKLITIFDMIVKVIQILQKL